MGIIIVEGYSDLTMRRLVWKWGIPAPIWLKNLKLIEEKINKFNLHPVNSELLPAEPQAVTMGVRDKEEARLMIKRPPIPGGIKIPHLHFKGDIYLLDEKQWKEFSSQVVTDFQAKLNRVNVNAVSFEQVMEISEAVDGLM